MRINIDELSADFLEEQQEIAGLDDISAPMGFLDMAVNFGRYLAITAPVQRIPITKGGVTEAGNVYVIDLAQESDEGLLDGAVHTLSPSAFTTPNSGRAPQYVTSGLNAGEFLLSSAKDHNHGVTSLRWQVGKDGALGDDVKASTPMLTPVNTDSRWLEKKDQENIQRAADTVVVLYNDIEYALVADYNFVFNDPHFVDYEDYGLGKQIGGKIGIIQDPFGKAGGPKYLGATTPIVGGSIRDLSLATDGSLFAEVWIDEGAGLNMGSGQMYKSLFVWNANLLVQAAVQATGPKSKPIDRDPTNNNQIVTPHRYDDVAPGVKFGSIYGIGNYNQNEDLVFLATVPPIPVATPKDLLPPTQKEMDADLSLTDRTLIHVGAGMNFLWGGYAAAVRGSLGLDNADQLKDMNEARKILNTLKLNDNNDPVAASFSVVENLIAGFAEVPFQVLDMALRLESMKRIVTNQALGVSDPVGPDMPSFSKFSSMVDNGATDAVIWAYAGWQALMANPVSGFVHGGYELVVGAIEGDWEKALNGAAGAALSFAWAKAEVKRLDGAKETMISQGKISAADLAKLNKLQAGTKLALREAQLKLKDMTRALNDAANVKKRRSVAETAKEGLEGAPKALLENPAKATSAAAESKSMAVWEEPSAITLDGLVKFADHLEGLEVRGTKPTITSDPLHERIDLQYGTAAEALKIRIEVIPDALLQGSDAAAFSLKLVDVPGKTTTQHGWGDMVKQGDPVVILVRKSALQNADRGLASLEGMVYEIADLHSRMTNGKKLSYDALKQAMDKIHEKGTEFSNMLMNDLNLQRLKTGEEDLLAKEEFSESEVESGNTFLLTLQKKIYRAGEKGLRDLTNKHEGDMLTKYENEYVAKYGINGPVIVEGQAKMRAKDPSGNTVDFIPDVLIKYFDADKNVRFQIVDAKLSQILDYTQGVTPARLQETFTQGHQEIAYEGIVSGVAGWEFRILGKDRNERLGLPSNKPAGKYYASKNSITAMLNPLVILETRSHKRLSNGNLDTVWTDVGYGYNGLGKSLTPLGTPLLPPPPSPPLLPPPSGGQPQTVLETGVGVVPVITDADVATILLAAHLTAPVWAGMSTRHR